MVDLSGSGTGAIQHSFDNSVFILPAAIILGIVAIVAYKLVTGLKDKQKKMEEKKKMKEMKKKK